MTKPWPARTMQECNDILTAPGQLWETETGLIDGRVLKYYKNTPGKTLRDLWLSSAVHGDKDYVIYEEERFTFTETHRIVARTANILLKEYGLVKGDRVALLSRNWPEWVFTFWACHLIGCVPVAINSWVAPEQMVHCLVNSGSRLLVADPQRLEEVSPQFKGAPELENVLLLRPEGKVLPNSGGVSLKTWDEIQKKYWEATAVPEADIQGDDLCVIFYTSGTTGLPKGVPGTSRMMLTGLLNILVAAARSTLRRGEDLPKPVEGAPQKALLMPAPLFHVTGSLNLLPLATFLGAKFIMMYKWDVAKALAIIKKEKVTHSGGVPFVMRSLLDAGLTEEERPLESISYGGAPSGPTLIQDCRRRFPNASFSQSYGMTEHYTICASSSGEDFDAKPASTGVATPTSSILVVDPQGKKLPPGEIGEIWLRGVSSAKEYWRMPDATKASWTPDGWFKTGDLGYMDEEDFLFIADRLKDIIIRGGENIPSIDVENGVLQDPRISECCCVSIPHPSLAEEVAVVVVPKAGQKVTEESVHAFVAKSLKPMWRPRFVLVQEEEVVKNANGKHDKKIVRVYVREAWAAREGKEASRAKL